MSLFDDVINGKEININDESITESDNEFNNDGYDLFTEAVYPEALPYLKTLRRKITLPIGKRAGRGNLCYLYTNSTKESIDIINNKINFVNNKHFYFYYYNLIYRGKLYNKKYMIRDLDERRELYRKIKKTTTVHPYIQTVIDENETRNMYFDLSKYIEIFFSICNSRPPLAKMKMYWDYMRSLVLSNYPQGYTYKFILINIDNFDLGEELKENLNNPLFMIYYTLFRKPELLDDFNIDFYFYTKDRCLKINPSMHDKKTYVKLKIEMRKLYAHVKKEKVDNAIDEEKIKTSEAIAETKSSITDTIEKNEPKTEINSLSEIKKIEDEQNQSSIYKKVDNTVNKVYQAIKTSVPDTKDIPVDTIKSAMKAETENNVSDDKDLLNEIYDKTIGSTQPKSAASTARDELLRKNQKNITVGNMTINDIEKIDANKVKIPVHDVSEKVTTTNKNMTKLKFDNIDKTYIEKVMPKDITNAFLALNNKSIPMYIIKVNVEDTSDELNYKDTYTITMEDVNRKRHTIKVDIPKFIDDKFLYIGGNKKLIKHQSYLYPVVKVNSNTVYINTNYNKMEMVRVDNRSLNSIEKLKNLMKKNTEVANFFTVGNSFFMNKQFITTLEYDEFAKFVTEYKKEKARIIFDQNKAREYASDNNIKLDDKSIFIGVDKDGKPIHIQLDTQKTKDGKSIIDIIIDSLGEYAEPLKSLTEPKRVMYIRAKLMAKHIPVGVLLGFWEGLSNLTKKLNLTYRLENKKPNNLSPEESVIRFADCYMVYSGNPGSMMIINGLKFMDTNKYNISELDEKDSYMNYIMKIYGKMIVANSLTNAYEFFIDPITQEILEDLHLPTDITDLIIYAVSLLEDSQYTRETNQGLSRIRQAEIIPAILYDKLAKAYTPFKNSNGRKQYSIPRDAVIKEVLGLKTVEDYSTLNPTVELELTHGVSSKGFRGVNLEDSYNLERRSYDPSMTGIISPSSSPDGSVGVNKTLSMEPTITSVRGYVDTNENNLDNLHDTNLFSPGELSIPLGASRDDPTRLGHAIKQSKHVIPVKNSSPVLMSNGFEEICRFKLSSDFVINAEEDGQIVDYDEKSKIMIAKYKSGKCRAINLGKTIVKNGNGGFFLSNELVTTLKVGDKFKKDDVLAYHKDFFTNDRFNNCRMNMGTLSKVAIMSTYNTYQDATMITEKLSDDAATEMCFLKQVTIGKNSNVEYIVEKGQNVSVGDSLIQFDTSYEDDSLNSLLAALSQDEKEQVLEGSRNDIKSKYSGVIEDIKIYSTVEIDQLSPTLRKIVKSYYNNINEKKEFLEKYDPDSKTSIVKCGMLVNETSKKIEPNKFGVIKGQKMDDGVLIEFYIKHSEPLEIGSKIANFTALKNTIGEIIPAGYEPWSEFRPDEEVSTIIASNSILKRMTPSVILSALGNKCIIELKNRLKEIYEEK